MTHKPTAMVGRWSSFGSNWVAECPECGQVCVYWDEDDLEEDEMGVLYLFCYGPTS